MMTSFHKIAVWIFIWSSSLLKLEASCLQTSCDCYEDEFSGLVEYLCPNRMKNRLLIRSDEIHKIGVICTDKTSVDHILPRHVFSYEHVTIENCDISRSMANTLNITNIKTLKMDDCSLQEEFVDYIFSIHLPRLERLTFRNTQLENVFLQNIDAPNLFFIDFEKMDYNVASKTLNNLTQVEILNFMNNEIDTVKSDTFENLSNLRELHMMFNSIENINNEAFKNLSELRILNLANNNLRFISRHALEPLQSLQHVTLEGNFGLSLDDNLFANFSKLAIVHLGASDITLVPENIFAGSTSLSEISLDNNNISFIPMELFKGLIELRSLDLKFNKIKALNGVFRDLEKLQVLELNNNEILSIESGDFLGLNSLVDLNLEYNNINLIHENAFRNTINLETLDLSHNKYQYELITGKVFTSTPFSKCEKLKSLDLSFNLLKDIPDDIFINTRLLKYLNLEGNNIETLNLEDIMRWNIGFKGVNINLKKNNITHFIFDQSMLDKIDPDYDLIFEELAFDDSVNIDKKNVSEQGEPSTISIAQTLKCDCYMESMSEFARKANTGIFLDLNELICASPADLKDVRFLVVPASEMVCDLASVTEYSKCTNSENCSCLWRPYDMTIIVNCSSNNVTESPVINAPMDLIYRKIEVHLEGNMLKEFSSVEGYENVTSLFLASNRIENISWMPPNIEIIDISFNNLTGLDHSIRDAMSVSSVKNVTLGNNPWLCDCNGYEMTNFLRKNLQKIDTSHLFCEGSTTLLMNLNDKDLCPTNPILFTSEAVILCLCFVSSLAAFYYKFQQEIKVWMYAHNICLFLIEEEELDKDKIYDAFVSYSHKDEDFVIENLISILEGGPKPYKLCLHFRNWIPGEFIAKQVTTSVNDSRRTLVVLSPNFLDSVWGKMEFRTAHSEAMREGRARVIIVLYGDIDMESLDDELKTYMNTNTYIKWGDPWFWDKLKYALPHSRIKGLNSKSQKHANMMKYIEDKFALVDDKSLSKTESNASIPCQIRKKDEELRFEEDVILKNEIA